MLPSAPRAPLYPSPPTSLPQHKLLALTPSLWKLIPAACRLSPTPELCRQHPASVTPTSMTPHCIYESFFTPCQQRCVPSCHPMSSPCPLQPPGSRTAHGAGRLPRSHMLPILSCPQGHHLHPATTAGLKPQPPAPWDWDIVPLGPPPRTGTMQEPLRRPAARMPEEGTKRTARCSLNSRLFAQAAAAL